MSEANALYNNEFAKAHNFTSSWILNQVQDDKNLAVFSKSSFLETRCITSSKTSELKILPP